MELGLRGKTAMVGGASRGLGLAVAKLLASEGVNVSICSRNAETITTAARHIKETGAENVFAVAADLGSVSAIEGWHDETVRNFGPVDLLVTNTGGPVTGTSTMFNDSDWQTAFELLVLSAIRIVRLVAPSMALRNSGSIVLLTSSSVKEPIATLALSNVMRASVSALAKTLALEFASRNVRVNQLIPGRIATDRLRELDKGNSELLGISLEQQKSRSISAIPLGRYGQPEELARAAVFLLSEASSYITGATLQVDGGLLRSVI